MALPQRPRRAPRPAPPVVEPNPGQVDRREFLPFLERDLLKITAQEQPGVVDQNIEPTNRAVASAMAASHCAGSVTSKA